jgi:hypothetical protein
MQEAAQYLALELEAGQAWILRCMCVEYAKFLYELLGCLEFLQCCTGRCYVHVWSTFACKKTDQKQNKDRELREGIRETETEFVCVCVKSLGFTASEASCQNKVVVFSRSSRHENTKLQKL